jgi:O-antigen/teichoic acid export membrane protein
MDLKKRTIRNSVYSLAAFVWPISLSFIATPFVVHHLGQDKYGVLALVTSFIGFFAVLDFGVSPSLVKYVAEHHAKKDYPRVNQFFSSALLFYSAIGLIGAGLIIIAAFLFAPHLVKNSPELINITKIVFFISAFGFLINMLLSALTSIPGALQRFDLTSKLNMIVASSSTIGTVLLLFLGFGLIAIVIYTVLLSLLAAIAYVAIDKKLLPTLQVRIKPDPNSLKEMFGFSGYAFIASVSGVVIAELDRLILGFILGPKAVTYYVIPGNIAIKILGAVVAASTVIFPLTSELVARGDIDKLRNLYARSSRFIIILLTLGIVPLIVFAHRFLLFWLGPDFARTSGPTLQILLLTYFISSLHVIPFLVAYGSGKPKYSAIYASCVAVLNIVLMFALIPHFQIIGAAYAYLFAVVPTTILFVLFIEKKLLSLDNGSFYLRLIGKLLVIAAVSLALSVFLKQFITDLKSFLVMYVLVVVISGAIYALSPLMDKNDIELVKTLRRGGV